MLAYRWGMYSDLTIIERRVDWVSCSAKTEPKAKALSLIANKRLCLEWEAGDRVSYWGFPGYRGTQCGHWKYAEGEDGVIVQVGGTEADQWCQTLASYAEHFSRVDYCVTVVMPKGAPKPSDALYAALLARADQGEEIVKTKQLREIHAGAGIAIGARTGAQHIRVYDKNAESKGVYPENCWRYEVEMKRHLSEMEQTHLLVDHRRPSQALEVVDAALAKWKVEVPWDCKTPVQLDKAPKRTRDAERALRWMREQVAPTVEWLISNGREGDVREALNLAK